MSSASCRETEMDSFDYWVATRSCRGMRQRALQKHDATFSTVPLLRWPEGSIDTLCRGVGFFPVEKEAIMKSLTMFFFMSLCLTGAGAQQDSTGKYSPPAQPTPAQSAAPEPEMADIFYRLDGAKLVPLERQAASIHSGAHGFIVYGMKSASEFPGAKSPARFKSGGHFDLIVRSAIPVSAIDPNTIYCLRKLNSKKTKRELIIMSGHVQPFGVSTSTPTAEGVLPVEFSRYGMSSLKMTTGELAPGEYAVGHPYGPALFCFGVD
jgi:hypothetical protein